MKSIYIISCNDKIKVGIGNDPDQRAKGMQTGNPYELNVEFAQEVQDHMAVERNAHSRLTSMGFHDRGEWFSCSLSAAERVVKDCIERHGEGEERLTGITGAPTMKEALASITWKPPVRY